MMVFLRPTSRTPTQQPGQAIKAFHPDRACAPKRFSGAKARMVFDTPYTPEKVLMSLYA
jgi:hypothetical protein